MQIEFSKMQGLGNDFVVFDGRGGVPFSVPDFARTACDRHFGIGADGVVVLDVSSRADFRMFYFNADGSRAVCGNGLRCLARFLFSRGIVESNRQWVDIETDRGISRVVSDEGKAVFRVDMGIPCFEGKSIPVAEPGEHIGRMLRLGGQSYVITAVGMGNPHCVLFVSEEEDLSVEQLGPLFERHSFFPERTNVEFASVLSGDRLRMRVWERGVGETLACATGASAVAAAAVREGRAGRELSIEVKGGVFEICWNEDDGHIYLSGEAEEVFRGTVDPLLLRGNACSCCS